MSNQMEEMRPKLTVQDTLRYLLAYTCWFFSASISILTLFQIRSTFNVVWPVLGGSRWVLRPIDRFGLVLLGLIWLVYTIFAEHHYRSSITAVRMRQAKLKTSPPTQGKGSQENQAKRVLKKLGLDILVRRFIPMTAVPLALLLVFYLIQKIALRSLGG